MYSTLVSDQQRDRAVNHLQSCYANGMLDEMEFDRRLDSALGARDRAELNRSLRGLARIAPVAVPFPSAPIRRPGQPTPVENLAGGFTHLSGLFTWVLGPAVVKAVAAPGSRIWWEASRALSFQLTLGLVGITTFGLAMVLGVGGPMFLAMMGWFMGTVVTSVRAFSGKSGTGYLEPFLLMREKPRPGVLAPRR